MAHVTLLLVDGTGIAVRSWWASAKGCPDRFAAAVQRALPTGGADVVACWDGVGSWRRELFAPYKMNRPPKPEALGRALEDCRRAFPGFIADRYEADDLIATFARDTARENVVLVLSDDKDLLQLVAPRCLVVNSAGKVFDEKAVADKFGVPPYRIRHLLSWMGDKVDGLPGVPGYGKKRAAEMARDGKIGSTMTYDLTELATVPSSAMRRA